jgi:hypothetical protein
MSRSSPAVFAIEPVSGNVSYAFPVDIGGTSAATLADLVRGMVSIAAQWRMDYFLGQPAPQARQFVPTEQQV